MIPKMKQYIKAFSKEDEKEMMALKTDTTKGSVSGKILGCSNSNKGSRSGWKLISHIIWGFGDGAES